MWIDDDEYIVRCGCGDVAHPVHLYFDVGHIKDTEPHYHLDIGLQVVDVGLWQRIKNAFAYIFRQRKFWHYGEITLDLTHPKQREEVRGMVDFLNRCLKMANAEHRTE